jgi:hypothetical protein
MRISVIAILITSFGAFAPRPISASEPAPASQPALELSELDQHFQKTMTNATLAGQFTIDGDDKAPGKERYTIVGVRKLKGNYWLFNARIQFGTKDVTVPMVLPVLWAGDTPVITVTDVGMPGIGTYTARVMIYDDHYAGTWSGGKTHQGMLFGRIEHAPATQPAKND